MFAKIEDFFMNHFLGKLAMTAATSVAAYLASGAVGAKISVDPNQLATAMVAGANAALQMVQHWRAPVAAEKAAVQAVSQ